MKAQFLASKRFGNLHLQTSKLYFFLPGLTSILWSNHKTASTSKQSDLRSGQTVYFGEELNSGLKPDYNFYLIAAIGNGYSHHLFNIKPSEIRQDPYGYPLTIWAQIDKEMVIKIGEAKDVEKLKLSISEILTRPFVKNIIQTLLTQVELYNRSISGHYSTYYLLTISKTLLDALIQMKIM